MVRILVTNDDGYRSEGIHALALALREVGDVTTVAPVLEASAIGHALTLRHPLRLEAIGEGVFAVDGTPSDCVNIAIAQVFKGLPDLVVSGINKGWNLGDDITYSGTVAGALEGALLGIPSIAVSLRATRSEYDFSHAARTAAGFAEAVLGRPLPPLPRTVRHASHSAPRNGTRCWRSSRRLISHRTPMSRATSLAGSITC